MDETLTAERRRTRRELRLKATELTNLDDSKFGMAESRRTRLELRLTQPTQQIWTFQIQISDDSRRGRLDNATQKIFPVIKPNINTMAKTGESEKLFGIEGKEALVTLVTSEASKLRRIATIATKEREITICLKNEVTDEAVSGFKIR